MQPSPKEYKLPASFTPQKQEELFEEVIRIYDLADSVLESVAAENATYRSERLELIRPFVTQVTNSTNILSAFYTEVVRNGRPITRDLQDTLEKAFQNVFYAYKEFLEGVEAKFVTREGKL